MGDTRSYPGRYQLTFFSSRVSIFMSISKSAKIKVNLVDSISLRANSSESNHSDCSVNLRESQ